MYTLVDVGRVLGSLEKDRKSRRARDTDDSLSEQHADTNMDVKEDEESSIVRLNIEKHGISLISTRMMIFRTNYILLSVI